MHILFAGATGVVGRRALPMLLARGHRVTALTRRPEVVPALRRIGAEQAVGNVYDRSSLMRLVEQAAPDAVMHQLTDLASADLAANARLRIVGTRNLADAARAADVRRFVAQSISWAYSAGELPAEEDEPLDLSAAEPRRTTVRAVDVLEAAVRTFEHGVALRYGMLYGPGTWFASDGLRAEQARSGDLVAGPDLTSFLYVDDAARAAVDALDWPPGGPRRPAPSPTPRSARASTSRRTPSARPSRAVNICDQEPAAATEWMPVFAAAVGAPPPATATAPRQPWARGASAARAARLGWKPDHPTWRTGFLASVSR